MRVGIRSTMLAGLRVVLRRGAGPGKKINPFLKEAGIIIFSPMGHFRVGGGALILKRFWAEHVRPSPRPANHVGPAYPAPVFFHIASNRTLMHTAISGLAPTAAINNLRKARVIRDLAP